MKSCDLVVFQSITPAPRFSTPPTPPPAWPCASIPTEPPPPPTPVTSRPTWTAAPQRKRRYTETTLALRPGAQITLLTDLVIEARSTTRELFGFERADTVSTQPAEAIAHAAQSFGQEEDITVLTLQFAPA